MNQYVILRNEHASITIDFNIYKRYHEQYKNWRVVKINHKKEKK